MTSIFRLTGVDKPTTEPVATPEASNQTVDTSTSIVNDNPSNNKEGATTNPSGEIGDGKKEEIMVVVDGPLSRVYTEALNLVYAKENSGTMALVAAVDKLQADEEKEPVKGTYVYATNAGSLKNNSDVVDMTNWLSANKEHAEGEIIISIESHVSIFKNSALIEEVAKAHGAKVLYTRNSAMEAIKNAVSK